MTTTTRRSRRDPNSWTVVRLPQSDLAELVLELAAPLLERLGAAPAIEDAREAVALAVTFWNASVLASKLWEHPRVKELNDLRRRMHGRQAAPGDAATFDLLTERRGKHWLDPRLVESWSYEADETGARRLVCVMGLPDQVRVDVPPPIEKRIAIGGRFLDEVRIPAGASSYLSFPVEQHRGSVGVDRVATIRTRMATALRLFATGVLTPIGGAPVDIEVGGKKLGPMVLVEVSGGGFGVYNDMTVLAFRPAAISPGAGSSP